MSELNDEKMKKKKIWHLRNDGRHNGSLSH
jgi:hypothetical protein